MIRDLLKWVAPGLATVLGGTALLLTMTSANVASDVGAQGASAMQGAGYDWAELTVDARDVILSGTTTDREIVDAAVSRLANLSGVRTVTTDITLAPLARPYLFEARIDDGVVSIAGGVPDEHTRQLLLSRAGLEEGGLELRSGMPERRTWLAGAQYAVDQLSHFDQGQVTLSDLTLELTGRAKSERDFRDLLIIMRAGAPSGVALGSVDIRPALVSPYEWSASSDGARISVEGFVPDEALIERLRSADVAGLPVATGLALGSGEPVGFAELSQKLIEQLSRLEYGAATITDGQSSLTGAPPTAEVADDIVAQLESSGSIVVLDPPRISDYWTSATRQPGGLTIFDGYAPDEATREALGQRAGADITWLKLGRGAPERYQSAMDFGLAALERMSEGRFALRDNVVTLSGVARSGADYEALVAEMAASAPQGLVLVRAEISAPRAAQYNWTATKDTAGVISLSGMVPSPTVEATLLAAAGPSASENLTYASGEPSNFVAAAQTGIGLLQWLSDGKVVYDGTGWTVTGNAKSAIDKGAIDADFVIRQLAAAGWSMAVAEPIPAIPQVSPYLWSVSKTADGAIVLNGHAPTAGFQRFAAIHAGDKVTDRTSLGAGAPEGFIAAATAALDAVLALEAGSARFDGTSWSISGAAPSMEARDATLAALASTTDSSSWSIAVEAPEPVPAATTPYVWSATKSADGQVTLTGLVPAAALQRFLAVRAGEGAIDETAVDPTAPENFATDVVAAIDALAGVTEGAVRFDGSQWSLEGKLRDADSAATIDTALAAATTPADAWLLTLITPPPAPEAAVVTEQPAEPPAPEPASIDPAYAFSASRLPDGAVILSGQVPADPAMRYLGAITNGDTAAVSIAQGAPENFLPSAEAGLRALMQLTEGQLDFASGAWSLKGIAADEAVRDAVVAAVAANPEGNSWSLTVDVPPPAPEPAVAAVATTAAPPSEPVAAVDIAACQAPLADFSARNAILFQSGRAIIAAESDPALAELATDLSACPDAVVHIEGHTDADGDEQLNLALSVARAEAVVEALVQRGVTPARLYAVGYGESKPIADNESAEGKRLNRRIVVTVTGEHY